ncbi:hypothetical protein Tco_0645434 [Tanacetum coccineum]
MPSYFADSDTVLHGSGEQLMHNPSLFLVPVAFSCFYACTSRLTITSPLGVYKYAASHLRSKRIIKLCRIGLLNNSFKHKRLLSFVITVDHLVSPPLRRRQPGYSDVDAPDNFSDIECPTYSGRFSGVYYAELNIDHPAVQEEEITRGCWEILSSEKVRNNNLNNVFEVGACGLVKQNRLQRTPKTPHPEVDGSDYESLLEVAHVLSNKAAQGLNNSNNAVVGQEGADSLDYEA